MSAGVSDGGGWQRVLSWAQANVQIKARLIGPGPICRSQSLQRHHRNLSIADAPLCEPKIVFLSHYMSASTVT